MTTPVSVEPAGGPLAGDVRPPGDKSISHRALLLGAIAEGTTTARGLLDGQDVRSTAACLRALGAEIDWTGGVATITGGEPYPSSSSLDCGNSGTTLRLLTGLLAGYPLEATLTGDASLSRRPMKRIATPLREMGAEVELAYGGVAPVIVRGGDLRAIDFDSPLASAQVKSAVLLAGLRARGTTRVREPARSRDHTERLLRAMGVTLDEAPDGWVALPGGQRPLGGRIEVPADPSSAAFLLAAGLLVPGSLLRVRDVCVNPTRVGLFDALEAMGAVVDQEPGEAPPDAHEPTASLVARAPGELRAAALEGDVVVRAIDEVPILAVLAAFARGTTTIRDARELRLKESDRLALIARGLRALGVEVQELPDGLDIVGDPARTLRGGATIETEGDHRIAMAFAVAALRADAPVTIDDGECVAVSYPGFWADLARLRAGS